MVLFLSALQIVLRRSLANWRLLSCMAIGVLIAVALLSSSPLYSNAISDLGLSHALRQKPIEVMNVHVNAINYDINGEEYEQAGEFIDQRISKDIGSLIRQRERYIKSQYFLLAWPDRPIPSLAERPRGYLQVFTNLEKHMTLVEGRYADSLPAGLSAEDLADPGLEIEAMIGSETAEKLKVGVGDRLLLSDHRSGPLKQIAIRLTGIIDPIDPDEEFWFGLTEIFTVPQSESDPIIRVPLFIPEQTLFDGVSLIIPQTIADYHWLYYVDLDQINTQNAVAIKNRINSIERRIAIQWPRTAVFTSIGGVISTYQQKLLHTQIPLFLVVFQIVGIALYYLVTVGNMVVDGQTREIALLRSRGASTGQILGVYFTEGLIISAFGASVGPFLGAAVFSLLGKIGPFLPLTEGGFLPVRFSTLVFVLAIAAAVLCLLALLVPAFRAARLGVVHQRQYAARPPRAPFWQRYYLDLVLLVIGAVLYWELRERGSLLTYKVLGGQSTDYLLLVTPMLFMVAVAIVFLRLFPIIVSLAARLGKYVTSAPAVLGLWYMARNPVHYGRLILLLMMTAGVGMFSASFLGTLEQSYDERTLYSTGCDLRLEGLNRRSTGKEALIERYADIPEVKDVSVVYRERGVVGSMFAQTGFTMLAIDPQSFERVAWYRDDFSEKPLAELMNLLAEDEPMMQGLELPKGTESIGLWVNPVEPQPQLRIHARIEDSRGLYFNYELGSPDAEGWQYLEVNLSEESYIQPVSPLFLASIRLRRVGGGYDIGASRRIYYDDLQVRGPFSSEPVVVEDFEDVSDWDTMWKGSSPAPRDTFTASDEMVYSGATSGKFGWTSLVPSGHGSIFPNLETKPLAAVASRSFLRKSNVSVGSVVNVRMPGQDVPVIIEDVVEYFPTLDPDEEGFLIVNFDRASSLRNLVLSGSVYYYPNEVWLTVTSDEEQREAILDTPAFRADKIHDQQEILAKSEGDPLVGAGWGGILLIAFLGVILLSGLGFVVYAYLSARRRQIEFGILRTLGFSMRQIIGLVCFEQVFVISASMGIGTFVGVQLSSFMMPFLLLTQIGERVLPPFVLVTDWFTIGIAYIILTVAFVLTISLVVLFFSHVPLHRVMRLAEE